MNTYRQRIEKAEKQRINSWDAFVDYLDSTYFKGATELLDKQLVAFEYDAFKKCYVT